MATNGVGLKTTVEFSGIGQTSFRGDGILPGIPPVTGFVHAVLGKGFMEHHIPLPFVEPPVSPIPLSADKLWEHFLRQK